MSAADVPPVGRDELREAMAEALWSFVHGGSVDHRSQGHILDALLPVVTAWAERRAAAELRAAADEYADDAAWGCALHDRAEGLSAPSAPPGTPGHVPTDARGVTGRSRQGIGNDDGGDEPL